LGVGKPAAEKKKPSKWGKLKPAVERPPSPWAKLMPGKGKVEPESGAAKKSMGGIVGAAAALGRKEGGRGCTLVHLSSKHVRCLLQTED